MCIVCVDLIKQNMTILEAERNLDELVSTAPLNEETRELVFHQFKVKDALENMDLDTLADLMEESNETPTT